MKYKTHNQTEINADFTYMISRMIATYDELVTIFGPPMPGDGSKVDAEWRLKFADDTVVTIYNWKNGRAYLGPKGVPKELIGVWNIGGKSSRAYDLLSLVVLARRNVIKE